MRSMRRHKSIYVFGISILVLVSGIACWNIYEILLTLKAQQKSYEVQSDISGFAQTVRDADFHEYGFLAAQSEEFYTQLSEVFPVLRQKHMELTQSVSERENHRVLSDRLGYLVDRKVELLDEFKLHKEEGEIDQALGVLGTRENTRLISEIDNVIREMDGIENEARQTGAIFIARSSLISMVAIVIGTLAAIILIFIFARRTQEEMNRQIKLDKELNKAREAALISSRLKSQFLATISHEIRTPLNGIIGLSDLLKNRTNDPESIRLATIIHTSGQSLLRILNDILDFAKVEAGRIEFEISKFSVLSLVETSAELHSARAKEKGLTVLTYVDGNIPRDLSGDASRIFQVLNNLVGNSIKFTSQGTIMTHVSLQGQANKEATLLFKVQDTGPGISKSNLPLLFQPFNQMCSNEDTKEAGTGLGLSICKQLIEKMGGEIGVNTKEGYGSTFWFKLPVRVESDKKIKDVSTVKDPYAEVVYAGSVPAYEKTLRLYAKESGFKFKPILSLSGLSPRSSDSHSKALVLFHLTHENLKLVDEFIEFDDQYDFVAILSSDVSLSDDVVARLKSFLTSPFTREQFFNVLNKSSNQMTARNPSQDALLTESTNKLNSMSPNSNVIYLDESLSPGDVNLESKQDGEVPKVKKTILLVEDNPTNLILAQSYVEKLGFAAHVASNGKEALELQASHKYDAILMDCRMPVMNGLEATRQIRLQESDTGRRVPIIAMTANAMHGDKDKCISVGMDDYLAKPFSLEDLKSTLSRWVNSEETASELSGINWGVLKELESKTNKSLVNKLVASFKKTLPVGLENIESSFKKKDFKNLKFFAHQLKSSSATLGAQKLGELCSEVEECLERQSEAQAPSEDLSSKVKDLLSEGLIVLKDFEVYKIDSSVSL